MTTAWANSSTFLKILSCPPPKYEFAPQMPPPPQILRPGAATAWMNDSIRSYILDQAEIIPDADSEARVFDKHTLYWAIIHDFDFQAGDE